MTALLRIAALVGVLSLAALGAAQTDRKAKVDEEYFCVARHLCNDQGFIIKDGPGYVKLWETAHRPENDTCSTFGEVVCKSTVPDKLPFWLSLDIRDLNLDCYKSCGNQSKCAPEFLCYSPSGARVPLNRGGADDECNYLDVCCEPPNKIRTDVQFVYMPVPVMQPIPLTADTRGPSEDSYKSCGFQKECVPRFLCKDGIILTSGVPVRPKRNAGVGDGCNYPDVCCELPNKIKAGVVVWGIGCGEYNVPGVYANVAHLRPCLDQPIK